MLWIREVNRAFKEYVLTLYADVIKKHDVKVVVRTPQTKALDEHIPCISIYTYDLGHNYPMTDVNSKDYQVEGKTIKITDKPLKYNLGVQIDFYTRSQDLLDTLGYLLISDKYPYSTLDVTDSEGNIYTCSLKRNQYPVRLDNVDGSNIVYRVTYTHELTIPITYKPQIVAMVEKVNPTIKNQKEE